MPAAPYSEEARAAKIGGHVIADAVVAGERKIENIGIVKPPGMNWPRRWRDPHAGSE